MLRHLRAKRVCATIHTEIEGERERESLAAPSIEGNIWRENVHPLAAWWVLDEAT